MTVADESLQNNRPELLNLAGRVIETANRHGATSAECLLNQGQGLSVTVRLGEVETVQHHRDKGLQVTVYFDQRSGSASTSDFSETAVNETVSAACSIARYTAEDQFSGLADVGLLATSFPDLDLYHPWAMDTETAIELGQRCEHAARSHDGRITNSEGATCHTGEGIKIYANSHGFCQASIGSRHGISCSLIAETDGQMQRDYWYDSKRRADELPTPEMIGEIAAERTLSRLGARRLSTRQCPVIFEAPIASGLIAHFVGAIRGSSLYRGASFLVDSLGQQIFATGIRIYEQPHLPRGHGSCNFDAEGVVTRERDLVKSGIVQGYVLDSYSGRKLGMPTTANAGGVHNLTLEPGKLGREQLIQEMGNGLLLTELIGHGINGVTGDYSRGGVGFWIENGKIQYPVEEITVAGNLKQMYRQFRAVGNDVDERGNTRCGSILVDGMTIAGD